LELLLEEQEESQLFFFFSLFAASVWGLAYGGRRYKLSSMQEDLDPQMLNL
jgi:hypothetical protein